jgi:DNA topoisomerase-1
MEKSSTNQNIAPPGLSVRNGPVIDAMDIDEPVLNGKRKARNSIAKVNYNVAASESEEDDKPLVRIYQI